jgi:hypothetical protein
MAKSASSFRLRVGLILGLLVLAVAAIVAMPPYRQSAGYHGFADQRTIWGIPHFMNVVSNIPFILVGLAGFREIMGKAARPDGAFQDTSERWPFVVLFAGILLTGFGSAYYHLDPTSDRLVWDRLPMTLAFTALFASTIAERISLRIGIGLLGPLVVLGFASVWYWHEGELHGTGDLRLYGLVQFYPLTAIPLMLLLFTPRYTGTIYLWAALGWYVVAKGVEILDEPIYQALAERLSGHTVKHVAAAVGAGALVQLVRIRRPIRTA